MKGFFRSIGLAFMLLCMVPISAGAAEYLIPVGTVIGLQLRDNTVTVAAFDEDCPVAREAGVKIGDELVKIEDQTIGCPEDVRAVLQECEGEISLTVRRDGKTNTLHLHPETSEDGPRLGVYLRQGIAGIGTVTFYDPETGLFGTLGHGVNDGRGQLLAMRQGFAYEAQIASVIKGKAGQPGQLKGSADGAAVFGTLMRNTSQGVFGTTTQGWDGPSVPVAAFEEVHTGSATIRCTVTGDQVQEYSVEILKIYPQARADGRNFLLKVTDPELLALTGGIIQGMSGSPIIQDGQLIGAVTHVLVNDPTAGYGIFIENMLEAAA